ncbi:MAG: type I methionyl aminopeptidase [Parcubacteria group bacterium]|jgi:methionyl aminopeptidase
MISIKSQQEITAMREGGRILAGIMQKIGEAVAPGRNTWELNKLAEELIFQHGGVPSFKGYGAETGNPFPAAICASLNSEVVHGIPEKNKILKDGDVFKVDIGMQYQGLHTDMARSYAVGECSEQARKLIEVTEQAFWEGIKKMGPKKMLSDYSKTAQAVVEKNGFSVVRNLVGHGVGRELHEDPQIPNYYNKKFQDIELAPGMVLALEPMVNAGGFETVVGKDGWGFHSKDGSLTAHYENTILITEKGVEVLTVLS